MPTPRDIIIGVDSGASKTHAVSQFADGTAIGEGFAGGSNIRNDLEGSYTAIMAAISLSLGEITFNDPRYRVHIGLGLAGTEVPSREAAFRAKPLPFATLTIQSDAHIACLGAHNGADGSIISIGTGVIGYQIYQGSISRVGGWGFPHDDMGGGAWLGLSAMQHCLQAHDGRQSPSALSARIDEHFDHDFPAMVSWANLAKPADFAQLAPLVLATADAQEPTAMKILANAAKSIEMMVTALHAQSPSGVTLPCCITGGLAPFLIPLLSDTVKPQLTTPQHDAVTGALLMAHQQLASLTET